MKEFKPKRSNRFKRFFLNSEITYSKRELIINWLIFVSMGLMFLFGLLFSIYSRDIKINSFSDIGVAIPQPANTFSVVSFVFLVVLITSLILKAVIRRKRRKEEHVK